jgi:hypothetical protein
MELELSISELYRVDQVRCYLQRRRADGLSPVVELSPSCAKLALCIPPNDPLKADMPIPPS